MKRTVFIEMSVDIEIDEEQITKEVMDNYDQYFFEITDNDEYQIFKEQIDKHVANIALQLLRGKDTFIDGYGKVDDFVKNYSVDFGRFDDMWKYSK